MRGFAFELVKATFNLLNQFFKTMLLLPIHCR